MKCRGKKNTSKRKSLSLQHKIAKKSVEKKRVARKDAKKALKAGVKIKRKKKDMKIPGNWPFKHEELLFQKQKTDSRENEVERKKEAQRLQKKAERKKAAKARAAIPEKPVNSLSSVLENADVIIQVVDARDPLATRCVGIENIPSKPHKIIVVTKGDLVPKENLNNWIDYLRLKTGYPVLALMKKADSDEAKKYLDAQKLTGNCLFSKGNKAFTKPVGFKNFMKLMQVYSGLGKDIAVVGYPGVGKHTVERYLKSPQMNLPKKSKIQVASVMESIEDHADLLLGGRPQAAQQPLIPLKRVMERTFNKKDMQLKLALPAFEDSRDLLQHIEKERNLSSPMDAARTLLKIWNGLRYYSDVPVNKGDEKTYSNLDTLEPTKKSQVTAFTEQEMAIIHAENRQEIDAVTNWGYTTTTTGLLAEVLQNVESMNTKMNSSSSAMQGVEGNNVDVTYYPIKCPVSEQDLTQIIVGGPEPFGAQEDAAMDDDDEEEETDDGDDAMEE